MKTTAYYIKTGILIGLLLLQTILLSNSILNYVKTQQYFGPPKELLIHIAVLLLTLAYTQALTIGAWGKWEQLIIIPIPITLGIFIILIPLGIPNALTIAILIGLISAYQALRAQKLMELFVKFNPYFILRPLTGNLFFVFALLAGFCAFINPMQNIPVNIGKQIGELTENQVRELMIGNELYQTAKEFGVIDINLKDEITNQVNNFIEPYKSLLAPITAVLVFAIIRTLGLVAAIVFSVTIKPLFWLTIKTGLIKVGFEDVKKEVYRF